MSTEPTLSTHVLDTALGVPAAGIRVRLTHDGAALGEGVTDADGRVRDFGATLGVGHYALVFEVAEYFARTRREAFFREITVAFAIAEGARHLHVPLLLSPFGYSTYRGS